MELSINLNLGFWIFNRRDGQLLKAPPPILVTEERITNSRKDSQPLKAKSPILVTEEGITNSRKKLQNSKAELQITLVPFFILYFPIPSGALNSLKPSLLYLTPYSSLMASLQSSSVTSVESPASGAIIGTYSGLAISNNLEETVLRSFLAYAI